MGSANFGSPQQQQGGVGRAGSGPSRVPYFQGSKAPVNSVQMLDDLREA